MKLRNEIVLRISLVTKNSLIKQNAHQHMMHCMNISSTYRPIINMEIMTQMSNQHAYVVLQIIIS